MTSPQDRPVSRNLPAEPPPSDRVEGLSNRVEGLSNRVEGPGTEPPTSSRIGDAERSEAVRRIQRAMATGHIEFEEIGDRFALAYEARTAAELNLVVADLPPLAPVVPAHPAPALDFKLIGDIKRGSLGDVGGGYTCVNIIGDTRLDLTALDWSGGDVKISCWSVIGDITIIVPDGVRVQRGGVAILGDEKELLVPPVAGAPLLRIEVFQLIGDSKFYSLSLIPKGRLRKWWRKLRSAGDQNGPPQ